MDDDERLAELETRVSDLEKLGAELESAMGVVVRETSALRDEVHFELKTMQSHSRHVRMTESLMLTVLEEMAEGRTDKAAETLLRLIDEHRGLIDEENKGVD